MKTTVRIVLLFMFFYNFSLIHAQGLGEFKPSTQDYGTGKLKKNAKRIYIASFNVNFEVYKEAINYKASGGFGGNVKGEAMARGAIGLNGLLQEDIQAKTNQLYNEFVADLKSKGFEIISPEVASKTTTYEGWEQETGPYVAESGMPGVMTAVPEGYTFFYKKEDSKGKKKKGTFGGAFVPQKLSNELDDAVIADVDLFFMYSEDGDDWLRGNGAQVKMFTNFRLINTHYVSAPKENKVIGLKGAQTFDHIQSNVMFTQCKIGMGAETQYTGSLKTPLEIDGVIKKEKMVVYSKQGSATVTSITPIVIVGPSYSENTKWLDVDSQKYALGLYNAGSKMLKHHTSEFLSNY
jgi:hypothetical protein